MVTVGKKEENYVRIYIIFFIVAYELVFVFDFLFSFSIFFVLFFSNVKESVIIVCCVGLADCILCL